ncbi:hypothetical protein ACLB2K_076589 [Fragaria x ananassa]
MARVKHTATRRGRTKSARTPPVTENPNNFESAEGSSPATSPAASRGPGRPRKNPISPGSQTLRTPRSNAATGPPTQTQRKKRRNRPGTAALREIRYFHKSVKLVIPSAPFIRCVREVTGTLSNDVTRWTAEALQCIHEAAEDYLVHLFEDSMLCAIHAKRVTLRGKQSLLLGQVLIPVSAVVQKLSVFLFHFISLSILVAFRILILVSVFIVASSFSSSPSGHVFT